MPYRDSVGVTGDRNFASNNDYLNSLCHLHCKEGVTGAISFTKGFYTKICKHLGINYKELSRLGKAVLKAHAIDTLQLRHGGDCFFQGDCYTKK